MSQQPLGLPLLGVHDVSKSFGAQLVVDRISVTIHEGDRIGLIGKNGSGKSTLMKIVAGVLEPDEGHLTRRQGLRAALLTQRADPTSPHTVGEILGNAQQDIRHSLERYHSLTEILGAIPSDSPEHARLHHEAAALEHELELSGAWDLDQDIKRISIALNLPAPERPFRTLSGGEQRRVALAASIIQHPDLLLLDEPTNHIDVESIQWIEDYLAAYRGSCVLVTHDRYFLDRVVNRIVELAFGRLTSFPGNYERFLEYKAMREAHENRTEASRQAIMRRELEWLRRGPKARGTKQKARIKRYATLEAQDPLRDDRQLAFAIPEAARLGKTILEAEGLSKSYGPQCLFHDFSLIMQSRMRVGIVGPNGCGKTTLLRVLMGNEQTDDGKIRRGETTQFLYVDQTHEEVNLEHTILQHVSHGTKELEINGQRLYVPAYLERFLFDRDSINMPMRNLSGGELNRIDLAKKLLRGGNFLILDEPTNDLDLPTLRVLEEAVLAFDGCSMLVSHDRYFLNRVCTHILVFEGGGEVVRISGNYDDYLTYRAHRDAESARAAQEAKRESKPSKPALEPADKIRRLTWKEKKEYETIEQDIHAAEAAVQRLEAQLSQAGFYDKGYEAARDVLDALEAARLRAESLYARWLELSQIAED